MRAQMGNPRHDRDRGMFAGLVFPWHPAELLVPGLIIVVVGLVSSRLCGDWPPRTWHDVAATVRESQLPAVMVSSIAAAVHATVLSKDSIIEPAYGGRPVAKRLARESAVLWCWVSLCYAVGFIPLVVVTSRVATGGRFDVLSYLSVAFGVGTLAVVAFVIAGLVSRRCPRLIAVAVSVGAVAACCAVPVALSTNPVGVSLLALAPYWGLEFPFVGDALSVAVTVSRICFAVLSAVCSVTMMGAWLSRGSMAHRAASLLWLVPPMVMVVVVTSMQPNLVVPDRDARAVCRREGMVLTCVESSYSALLSPVSDAVSDVYERFEPGVPKLVIGAGLHAAFLRDVPGVPDADGYRIVDVGLGVSDADTPRRYRDMVLGDVARDLSGVSACGEASGESADIAYLLWRDLESYLRDGEFPDDGDAGPGMASDPASWYEARREPIRTCSLSWKDWNR